MNPIGILVIGVVLLIAMILVLRLNAFVALISSAIVVSLLSPGEFADKVTRVGQAFGSVAGSIGIVIALAAIIGKCMMDSGAADRIVRSFLKILGEKRAPTALMLSGFVLSIPVFFDTVFYLLVPLVRSLWIRTHKNYMLYVTAIVAGQEKPDSLDENQLPPFWISFTPIALPVILISLNSVTSALGVGKTMSQIAAVLGNRDMALLLATAIAMYILVRYRRISLRDLATRAETALMSGGIIILITAGGGAFGAMLREAGIKNLLQEIIGGQGQTVGLVLLLIAFAVAVVMKFAQGSGTVSMIATVSIFAAMGISPKMLGCNLVYLAMAIGSGSLIGDWMNNSGFWIFSRMGGFTEVETLKSWTIVTAALGLIGLGFTLFFAYLLPMVPGA